MEHINDPCCAATNRYVKDGDKFPEKQSAVTRNPKSTTRLLLLTLPGLLLQEEDGRQGS